jgi:hypothetical protein
VPEVGSDLEKVAHGYWCHSSPYTVIPPRDAFTTPKGHRSGASGSACVFRSLAGADVRFGRSGILARGAEPLGDPPNEAEPLLARPTNDEQEVDAAPLWEAGTLPPQSPASCVLPGALMVRLHPRSHGDAPRWQRGGRAGHVRAGPPQVARVAGCARGSPSRCERGSAPQELRLHDRRLHAAHC